jgi:glutathione S-transferase
MYQLFIANKNYSSWSLRPWVLLREREIPFEERLETFDAPHTAAKFRRFSPGGTVPCLVDGETRVWDSLAIVEYLAEQHEGVWPADRVARAWARSASAEMHSGFSALRNRCSMSCGVRIRLPQIPDDLNNNLARLNELWSEGLSRFGGPFLAGECFTAVDAFFCPVAFRIQTYDLKLEPVPAAYAGRLLNLPSMRDWYDSALAETVRDWAHEEDLKALGELTQDLRAAAKR